MSPRTDCCCCCFSVKTGTMLIGILAILSTIGTAVEMFGYYNEIFYWYILSFVIQVKTVIHFGLMVGHLDTAQDEKFRNRF